jgi:multidrug efflux pump subunit AcrB
MNQVIIMTDPAAAQSQQTETTQSRDQENSMQSGTESRQDDPFETSAKFREASYVVLFIAAVFVVNAMETGSYRTPWPVAIAVTLAGLGLFGYSWYLRAQAREK